MVGFSWGALFSVSGFLKLSRELPGWKWGTGDHLFHLWMGRTKVVQKESGTKVT